MEEEGCEVQRCHHELELIMLMWASIVKLCHNSYSYNPSVRQLSHVKLYKHGRTSSQRAALLLLAKGHKTQMVKEWINYSVRSGPEPSVHASGNNKTSESLQWISRLFTAMS